MPSRNDLPRMIEQLERVGDELRLQLHLAGMDARKEWSSLERELFQVRERLSPHRARANGTRLGRAVAMGRAVRRFVVAHIKSPLRRRAPAFATLPYGFVAELRGVSMRAAINRITRELNREGFTVSPSIDPRADAKAGGDAGAHRMLSACSRELAARALERDAHSTLLVTCHLAVREKRKGVELSALSPRLLLESSEAEMADIADEVEKRLVRALEAIARA